MRFDIGIRGSVNRSAGGEGQCVTLQPVVGGLDESEESEDDGDMSLHLGGDSLTRHLESDTAIEIVSNDRDEQDDDAGGEEPVDHGCVEGKFEHVEADVGLERFILHAE